MAYSFQTISFNGFWWFWVILPFGSMVFNGYRPLVQRCNGFDGSLTSIGQQNSCHTGKMKYIFEWAYSSDELKHKTWAFSCGNDALAFPGYGNNNFWRMQQQQQCQLSWVGQGPTVALVFSCCYNLTCPTHQSCPNQTIYLNAQRWNSPPMQNWEIQFCQKCLTRNPVLQSLARIP